MVRYKYEEVDDIRAEFTERDGQAFTIDSATVTITAYEDETSLNRKDVAASVVNNEVYFHETFIAANGYVQGGCYTATFIATITRGTSEYTKKAVVDFMVEDVKDVL